MSDIAEEAKRLLAQNDPATHYPRRLVAGLLNETQRLRAACDLAQGENLWIVLERDTIIRERDEARAALHELVRIFDTQPTFNPNEELGCQMDSIVTGYADAAWAEARRIVGEKGEKGEA